MKKELLENIEKTESWIDKSLTTAASRFEKSIQRLEKKIVSLAGRISVDPAGNIKGPEWTLKQAQKLHVQMVTQFDEIFGGAVKRHVAGFDDALTLIDTTLEHIDIPVNYSKTDKAMIKQLSTNTVAAFAAISTEFQKRAAQSLYDATLTGVPFSTLIDEMRNHLTGLKDKIGRPMTMYAQTLSQDNLMMFYSTMHIKKAADAGLDNFLYVGDTIKTTRPFCIARAGRMFTREEINSWTHSWKGKSGPAMSHRGGYNCRHHWQPVKPEWVDEGLHGLKEDVEVEKVVSPVKVESKKKSKVTAKPNTPDD